MESLPKKLIKGWASMLKWIKEKIRARKFITGYFNPDDIVFVYTGGLGNTDNRRSLGGAWGAEFPAHYMEEIFPPDEELRTYKPGEVIFRAIGIKNIGNKTIYFPSVQFVALPIAPGHTVRPPVDYLFAGWAKEPVNIPPEAIENEHAEPQGIVWNKMGERLKMPEYCLRPGDIKGLWLKLRITEYTPRIPAALLVDWALLEDALPI
jgi:hypothetical protein